MNSSIGISNQKIRKFRNRQSHHYRLFHAFPICLVGTLIVGEKALRCHRYSVFTSMQFMNA